MEKVAFGRLMRAISKNIEMQFKSRLSDLDFDFESNYSYFQYLLVISVYDGINQNELAQRMNVGKPSASKAVKYLLQKGLVSRKQDEADTRIKNVYITEKGSRNAARFKDVFLELNSKLVEGFTESEKDVLRNMLERIYRNTAMNENNFVLDSLNFLDK